MTLLEFKQRANTHMTHAEDLVLLGSEGLEEFNDKIEKYIDQMTTGESSLNITQKIDGAPAVICWSKFDGYPDNSICLKSFVNSNKNCLSSPEDIKAKYGDRSDMVEKLLYCLELANCIPAGEAWQGDCLYTRNNLREENIDGNIYLIFQPNKIVYAFTEDNKQYNKIKHSNFGICFHTIYTGDLLNKRQSFNVNACRLTDVPVGVFVMSPALDIDKSGLDISKIELEFDQLLKLETVLLADSGYEELANNSIFMGYWNTFENSRLADRKQTNININDFYSDFIQYVKDKAGKALDTKLASLKTDAAKDKAKGNFENELKNIEDIDKELLTKLVRVLNKAADIKMLIWDSLKNSRQDYSTFYRSRTTGYFPADMEGIALSDQEGNVIKIVDRSTFSNANRDPDIMSGFEH